jgi:hypothetical protein
VFEKWEEEKENNKPINELREYLRFSPAQIFKWTSHSIWIAVKSL